MSNKGSTNDRRNKTASKTKINKKIRPWIPPPGKTSGSLMNLETKPRCIKNKVCENETLQDIQKKVTELDSFVKSLDSVLGKVGKEPTEENETKTKSFILHTNNSKTAKGNESAKNKIKEYKKKVKLLLKVVHLSELEVKNIKEILEEKENDLILLMKDRSHLKLKLQESDKEKGEVTLKLENILEKLNEIENNQAFRESNQGDSNAVLKLQEENEKLKAEELHLKTRIDKYEAEIKHLKDKIKKSPKDGETKELKSNETAKLQATLDTMEKQNVFFQNALKTMEKQLEEAHNSILQLTSDLNKTQEKLKQTKKQKEINSTLEDLNISNSEDLKALHEELVAKKMRISILKEKVQEKSDEVVKITEEKQKLEEDYRMKLKSSERQLQISLNTNRSLQNYLTHLKNSYASVFSHQIL